MSAYALSLKLATSEKFFPYNIYPMRTIEIKYAILYLLLTHFKNTFHSTITSIVTLYKPPYPKIECCATLNIDMGRGSMILKILHTPLLGSVLQLLPG